MEDVTLSIKFSDLPYNEAFSIEVNGDIYKKVKHEDYNYALVKKVDFLFECLYKNIPDDWCVYRVFDKAEYLVEITQTKQIYKRVTASSQKEAEELAMHMLGCAHEVTNIRITDTFCQL